MSQAEEDARAAAHRAQQQRRQVYERARIRQLAGNDTARGALDARYEPVTHLDRPDRLPPWERWG